MVMQTYIFFLVDNTYLYTINLQKSNFGWIYF